MSIFKKIKRGGANPGPTSLPHPLLIPPTSPQALPSCSDSLCRISCLSHNQTSKDINLMPVDIHVILLTFNSPLTAH